MSYHSFIKIRICDSEYLFEPFLVYSVGCVPAVDGIVVIVCVFDWRAEIDVDEFVAIAGSVLA